MEGLGKGIELLFILLKFIVYLGIPLAFGLGLLTGWLFL